MELRLCFNYIQFHALHVCQKKGGGTSNNKCHGIFLLFALRFLNNRKCYNYFVMYCYVFFSNSLHVSFVVVVIIIIILNKYLLIQSIPTCTGPAFHRSIFHSWRFSILWNVNKKSLFIISSLQVYVICTHLIVNIPILNFMIFVFLKRYSSTTLCDVIGVQTLILPIKNERVLIRISD